MRKACEAGISLLEIMITVAIIAVVAAIAIPNLMAAKLASNETSAIATMRSLVSAQAQIQGLVAIDADNDSIGEYGTFGELAGATGIRRKRYDANGDKPQAVNFDEVTKFLEPPLLREDFADLTNEGFAVKSGYAFMMFLPDHSKRAKWTHEIVVEKVKKKGIVIKPKLQGEDGGSNKIGIDRSEYLWCAYAQPVKLTSSGNRCFFTNQRGDVLQSMNETAKRDGTTTAILPRSAYLGKGMTSQVAVGTVGYDGDMWKITN